MVWLQDTRIEIIDNAIERGHIRHALFDFDGTISHPRRVAAGNGASDAGNLISNPAL